MLSVLLVVLGIVLLAAGLVGCVLPILPGPPIAFLALICVSIDQGWAAYSPLEWVVLGALVAAVTVLDFLVPIVGAKRYGASRTAIWLSVVGMLVGLVMFPPFGMLVGAFIGAFLGELMTGKGSSAALGPAWGVFVGTVVGTGLKLAVCGVIAYYFVSALL
ncbi:MAG: DUF456 domain-containing protein [Planctomycetota bacterium]